MPTDQKPRFRTLGEFAENADGTYSGVKVVQWLMDSVCGYTPSESEVRDMFEKAKERTRGG